MLRYTLALALAPVLLALPPLTTIQDTLFLADGTKFNGLAVISWRSFVAADGSSVGAQTLRLQILNGFVRVQVVPTTNALTPAAYTVTFNSDGRVQFSETWAVPQTAAVLRLTDVRMSGSGSVILPPSVLSSIQIADVVGLQSALNIRPVEGTGFAASRAAVIDSFGAVDGALGSLSDCVHVDGTSGPCGGVPAAFLAFVDGETPAGTIDGVNAAFSVANSPNPPSSLQLYRDGLLLRRGFDYTLSGASIVFQTAAVPRPGDALTAAYRLGVTLAGVGFVDGETPAGTMNGSNATFSLAQSPVPAGSLAVYRNGLRFRVNVDFTLSGSTLVFLAGQIPQATDVILCSYRIVQ